MKKKGRKEGRKEGIIEGKQEGIREGKKEGIKEGRAAILMEQLDSLKKMLADRFGQIPVAWANALANLSEPGQIMEIVKALYTSNTPEDFEARLLDAVKA